MAEVFTIKSTQQLDDTVLYTLANNIEYESPLHICSQPQALSDDVSINSLQPLSVKKMATTCGQILQITSDLNNKDQSTFYYLPHGDSAQWQRIEYIDIQDLNDDDYAALAQYLSTAEHTYICAGDGIEIKVVDEEKTLFLSHDIILDKPIVKFVNAANVLGEGSFGVVKPIDLYAALTDDQLSQLSETHEDIQYPEVAKIYKQCLATREEVENERALMALFACYQVGRQLYTNNAGITASTMRRYDYDLKYYIQHILPTLSADEQLKQRIEITWRILNALHRLHIHKIEHNDVKTENILRSYNGNLCITDLGSATRNNTQKDIEPKGTPLYWEPSLINQRFRLRQPIKMDNKTDIGSLAMVLTELWGGQSLHEYHKDSGAYFSQEFYDRHKRYLKTQENKLQTNAKETTTALSVILSTMQIDTQQRPEIEDLCYYFWSLAHNHYSTIAAQVLPAEFRTTFSGEKKPHPSPGLAEFGMFGADPNFELEIPRQPNSPMVAPGPR